MNLETCFEKYELLADAPGAVAKMRELVLELAVRGKLVEQEESEGSPTQAQLHIEAFDEKEIPYIVPIGWRWTNIRDIAGSCGQKIPDQTFTYIDVASIDNTRGEIRSELSVISPEAAPSRARKLVRRGAVIYAMVRPYLT